MKNYIGDSVLVIFAATLMLGVLIGLDLSPQNKTTPTSSLQTTATSNAATKSKLPNKPTSSASSATTTTTPEPSSNTSSTTTAATNTDTDLNWSGYSTTTSDVTAVSGSWTVPSVSPSDTSLSSDATWIGIGGMSSDDLIQVGTQNVVESDGGVSSAAFYEMLPSSSEDVSSLSVNAGDSITASITESGDEVWLIKITDNTTGQSFETTTYYNSSMSSAEWIEEDPSDGASQQIPLDNFGTINFTGAEATIDGTNENLSQSNAQALTMLDDAGQTIASSSVVGDDGTSFDVNRSSATQEETGSSSEYAGNSGGWSRLGRGMWQDEGSEPPGYGY